MNKFMWIVVVLGLGWLAPSAFAAENADGAEYAYGTVKSVSDFEVTVTEYDYEKDEDRDVIYDLSGAKLENVKHVSEIRPDCTIDLMFRTENGRRVVLNASIEQEPGN